MILATKIKTAGALVGFQMTRRQRKLSKILNYSTQCALILEHNYQVLKAELEWLANSTGSGSSSRINLAMKAANEYVNLNSSSG